MRTLLLTPAAVLVALTLANGALAALVVPKRPQTPMVQRGYHLYGQYCISCHGSNGMGISQSGSGRIGAGPLRNQSRGTGIGSSLRGVGALSADFYLRTGYMPLPHVGVQPRRGKVLFSDADIKALVAYVASLAPGPAIPTPHPERGNIAVGLNLFTEHCAGCHQVVAQGGYVTGALAPPLEDDSPVQVAEAVRIGPFVMPEFTRKAISDHQLDSIVRYVQYAAKTPSQRGGWGIGYIGPVPEGLVTWFIAALAIVTTCIVIGKRLGSE